MPYTWYSYYSKFTDTFYAVAGIKKEDGTQTMIYLHRWIMAPEKDMFIDHINHDTLDNTRENLREVTVSENSLNRKRRHKGNRNSTTGVKGVYIQYGKYGALVTENGKNKWLGKFDTLELAKDCLDKYNNEKQII